mgnify:CR=1 FL=1
MAFTSPPSQVRSSHLFWDFYVLNVWSPMDQGSWKRTLNWAVLRSNNRSENFQEISEYWYESAINVCKILGNRSWTNDYRPHHDIVIKYARYSQKFSTRKKHQGLTHTLFFISPTSIWTVMYTSYKCAIWNFLSKINSNTSYVIAGNTNFRVTYPLFEGHYRRFMFF